METVGLNSVTTWHISSIPQDEDVGACVESALLFADSGNIW